MLTESHKDIASGNLIIDEPDASILAVIKFVEKHLIDFSQRYKNSNIKNEKGLTQKLVILLNRYVNDKTLFFFHVEYMENAERGRSAQVDIGTITRKESITIDTLTYSNDESFFSFEAKRLGDLEKKREKEYLIGRVEKEKYLNTGGVERFKQRIHGKNLKYGGIIGYVQKYDFDYWHNLINLWIENLIQKTIISKVCWTDYDKLKKEYIETLTAKFISLNSRDNDFITLFHLWVYI